MMQYKENLPTLTIPEIENKCLTSPKDFLIKIQNEKSIAELTKTDLPIFQFIGAVFIKINMLAGIKHNITDQDMSDIKNLVYINFKALSLVEIYKAFELERYGMFDDETDHYQLFNASYVSKILKKYQIWKRDKKVELNITKDSVPLLPEMSEVQKKKIAYDSLCATYDRIKKDGFDEMAWLIYKRIKEKVTLSSDEHLAIYLNEELKFLRELKQSGSKSDHLKAKAFVKFNPEIKNYDSAVLTQYKNRIVIDFVEPHLDTLETFLKAIGYED